MKRSFVVLLAIVISCVSSESLTEEPKSDPKKQDAKKMSDEEAREYLFNVLKNAVIEEVERYELTCENYSRHCYESAVYLHPPQFCAKIMKRYLCDGYTSDQDLLQFLQELEFQGDAAGGGARISPSFLTFNSFIGIFLATFGFNLSVVSYALWNRNGPI